MKEIIISNKNTEGHLALLESGRLLEYRLVRPLEDTSVGDIYYAVVEKIDRKINAAFLNLGGSEKAFIHMKDAPTDFKWTQGAKLPVQITREGTAIKLPLATGNIEFANDLVVLIESAHYLSVSKRLTSEQRSSWIKAVEPILGADEAVILRSKVAEKSIEEVTSAIYELRQRFQTLKEKIGSRKKAGLVEKNVLDFTEVISQWQQHYPDVMRVVTDDKRASIYTDYQEDTFHRYHLQPAIENLLQPEVVLANGVSLFIEKTEAMWIIDVNTHRYKSNQAKSEVMATVNLAAAEEIVRQIRLRNMSGLIVIDFVGGMNETGFQKVKDKMEVLANKEYVTTQVADFSKTGLMQLTRRKKQQSLLETVTVACPVCNGSGHIQSALSLAYQLERELMSYKGLSYASVYVTEPVLSAFLDLQVCEHIDLEWEIGEEAVPFYAIRRTES